MRSPATYVNLNGTISSDLWGNTSARFFVVDLDSLAFIVVGYETRCACFSQRNPLERGNQIADEEENELEDWIPELEEFLASLEIEGP